MRKDHAVSVVLMTVSAALGVAVSTTGNGPVFMSFARGRAESAPPHTMAAGLLVLALAGMLLLTVIWGIVQTIVGMVQLMKDEKPQTRRAAPRTSSEAARYAEQLDRIR